jgi:hypothetical protein
MAESGVKVKIKLTGAKAAGFLRDGAFGDTMANGTMTPRPKGGQKDSFQFKKGLDKKADSFAAKRQSGKVGGFKMPSSRAR